MTLTCPKCHHENPDEILYCGKCGTQFPSPEEVKVTETIEAPKEELTRGSTLANRYEIIEELGKGGMGRVYRVEDTKLKQEVALKLIKPEIAKDKKTIERFHNELKLAREIAHRNVCRMYDLNEEKGIHYITMEYVRGEDLRSLIRRIGQLPIGKSISIAKQVCEGLAEAHRLGVVHRDLKSNNIMIDKEGNVRIMDFGIARSLEAKGITGPGVMIGTPEYMSPEQVEGKEVDRRSDIYSLGVILYEMVTGRVPFEGDTPFTIGVKHKSETPKSPNEINVQIPADLNSIIMKCLEKDKERRYQSAEALRSDLDAQEECVPTADGEAPRRKPLTSKEITVTFGLKKLFFPIIAVIGLAIIGVVLWQTVLRKGPASPHSTQNSVAVLPFVDLSPEKDHEYLTDGISWALINALSNLEDLRVPARTSAFSFKGKELDVREIGQKLNVENVLEGSVQVAGDRLRITVQLISVKDDYHLWSEQYDRKLEDVLAIQDEISLAIANKLKVKLLEKEKAKLTKRYTGSQEAYNLYLKGISLSYSHTEKGYKKSIEYFKDAIDLDQSYALAYVGLANCYKELARLSYISPIDGYTKAKETAWKAIELDETLGEAYAILAHIRFIYDWDIYGPEGDFQRALELSPNSVDAYRMYIQYLSWIGKHDACVAAAKRVIELDPRTPLSNCLLGIVYFYAERYDESVSHLKNTLTLDPNFPWAHIYLAHNYSLMGAYDEAIAHSDKTESINPSFLQFVGVDYAICGRPEKAKQVLKQALEPTKEGSIDPITVAIIYAGLGEKEKAFQWLEKGFEARSGLMIYLRAYGQTFMRNISSDPRYKELLKKMGFKT